MVTTVGKQISQLERVCIETTDHSDPFGLDGLKQHLLLATLSRGVNGRYGDNRENANFLSRNILDDKKKYFTFGIKVIDYVGSHTKCFHRNFLSGGQCGDNRGKANP